MPTAPHSVATLKPGDIVAESAVAFAQASTKVEAPVERIWSLLTDIDHWPQWNPAVQRAHILGPVAPGTIFKWKSGGLSITSTLCDVRPMHDLTWTGVAFGTRARHGFELVKTDKDVHVTTRETFDGWLPALLPGVMTKALDRTLIALLASLKMAAENDGARQAP